MLRKLVSYSCSYEACMSPALNGSSAIRRFKHSDVLEIRNGIIFDFYMGLPHIDFWCGINQSVDISTNHRSISVKMGWTV